MLNGFTEINLTKLDVLSGFDEVKIGVKYLDKDTGKDVLGMPASLTQYSNIKVEYLTCPGWKEDISQCKTFEELPTNCKRYVHKLEELIRIHIRWIGVGPGRLDLIEREVLST